MVSFPPDTQRAGPLQATVARFAEALGRTLGQPVPALEVPPELSLGDVAVPCFSLAKALRQPPARCAELAAAQLAAALPEGVAAVAAAGPYLNVRLNRAAVSGQVVEHILATPRYGRSQTGAEQLVVLEFSSPNTNKPQHLGHVRNNLLGETVSATLRATGHRTVKTSIINDRGIHICKSMLAYERWGNGTTPTSAGMKGDHFVGEWYVRFDRELQAERQAWLAARQLDLKALPEQQARQHEAEFLAQSELYGAALDYLRRWEAHDPAVRQLWQTMNGWVYEGFDATYRRLGVTFDHVYHESDGAAEGTAKVKEAADAKTFERQPDGSIVARLGEDGLPDKVLLRADGTSLYATNDVSLAYRRLADYPDLSSIVYVVGSEQDLYFRQLFAILRRLGFPAASQLRHLSYGMVNLPEGKMKSREGTVVDADNVLNDLSGLAKEKLLYHIESTEATMLTEDEYSRRAEIIALAAIKIFMLKVTRNSDVTFNPKESLDFQGRTGVNILYTYARASTVLQKGNNSPIAIAGPYPTEPADAEWELITGLARYGEAVDESVRMFEPAALANYLLDLADSFNRFYHDQPILKAEPKVRDARLRLLEAYRFVVKDGLGLLGVEPLEEM